MFNFVNSIILTKLKHCVIICATRDYINRANLWGPASRCIHRSVMKCIMHFYAEMFSFFISRGYLTPISHKGSKRRPRQLVHNHWALTKLEGEVFKYNF